MVTDSHKAYGPLAYLGYSHFITGKFQMLKIQRIIEAMQRTVDVEYLSIRKRQNNIPFVTFEATMKYTQKKLTELQAELKKVVENVKSGKIDSVHAADAIVRLRDEMDTVIQHLKDIAKKQRA